jgi:hypothetical protein
MNYYKSNFVSIFLILSIIICIILIYNYGFSNVKNGAMNMNRVAIKEGFKEGLNPSLNQIPNFFAEFGSDTSKTVFNLDGWGLYSNTTTYSNEGLASLITSEPPVTQGTSGPRIAGFQGNSEVFITISCPRGLALNGIRWYGSGENGPDRNAKDVEVYGVNRGLEGISYRSDGSGVGFPTHILPQWWTSTANGFTRRTNFTVPQSCSLNSPSWFYFSPAAYYGDSSVKVNCLGLSFNPPDNISPPESTAAIRARKQAVIDAERQRQEAAAAAERQRQEAAAAETKRVAALADAKSAASAAIVAADAAVSVANGGGSSQPEMDAKKAANDSKTAATAASTAANSASTLQAAIDAKAAADKAKADADNAKSAANAAIAAAAASSLAQKKAEAKKNVDDALAIATQQIAALNASTSSTVANTETFIGTSCELSPARFESSSLFDKIVRFFAPLREGVVGDSATTDDLFASVKSKAAAAQAIITKTTPPATTQELSDALKLSLEALAEAQTIKTNLIACKASPRPTIKYNANTGAVPTMPADGSLYWATESGKDYLILSKKDASSPPVSVESTLVYCARKDKFIILYNSDIVASRKFIQYKIKSVTPIIPANTYVKYEVEIVSNTSGFTKANITNAQAVYISTSNMLTQMSTSDGSTAANPCAGPNPSANCKPVCIPTDATTGAMITKPGTTVPAEIFSGKPLSFNNYYEYKDTRGIAGDGSAVYYPMDESKTFVGNGTKCLAGCSEYDDGKTRESYCKPSKGNRPLGVEPPKTGGTCMTGCIAVTDPTDRRNSSRCSYNKISGYTCKPICDFGSAPNNCKINADCNDCVGDTYVKRFPIGWKPTITRTIDKTYTSDQCKEKCKKPTKDTCLNFLQLEQGGGYLENKCRKVGKTKVICKPISQVTPNGLIAGYDGCSVCKTDTGLYGYFEYEKEWNKVLKQWDFKNIKEITSPDKSWFEYGSGAGGGGGGSSGYGASSGSSGSGGYSSYSNDKGSGDSGDSKKTDDLKSGDSSKSVSISAASQDAKRQELSAIAADLKLKLDKLTTEYNDLVDSVKWNKLQMEKAEKECNDMKTKLKRAISDYAAAEAKSIKSGSTSKEKTDTEAANTLMYTIKHKTKEICNNYAYLKYKYTKSVYVLNELKNKKDDIKKQYDNAAADAGSVSGSGFGSLLNPIINIFFGDDANRDCSGQLGCGKGIDYTYPSPFNSAKGGLFTPQPYYDGIHF